MEPSLSISALDFLLADSANFIVAKSEVFGEDYSSTEQESIRIYLTLLAINNFVVK